MIFDNQYWHCYDSSSITELCAAKELFFFTTQTILIKKNNRYRILSARLNKVTWYCVRWWTTFNLTFKQNTYRWNKIINTYLNRDFIVLPKPCSISFAWFYSSRTFFTYWRQSLNWSFYTSPRGGQWSVFPTFRSTNFINVPEKKKRKGRILFGEGSFL